MRSESTSAFGQPRLMKPTRGGRCGARAVGRFARGWRAGAAVRVRVRVRAAGMAVLEKRAAILCRGGAATPTPVKLLLCGLGRGAGSGRHRRLLPRLQMHATE